MKRIMGMALACLAAMGASQAWAGDAKVGSIDVKGAWARATPPKAAAGGAFVSIVNGAGADDSLVSASAPVARTVELHTHQHQGDVMRMMAVPKIDLPAGKTVALEPGGLHIMLIGLAQPLVEGQSFPLTLEFAQAGKVTVNVDIKAVGAGPMGQGGAMMMHGADDHAKHMADPAMKAMHDEHMKDPAMKAMHDKMHGGQQ